MIIVSILTIIVYSGPAKNLGQKIGKLLVGAGTAASIYTGGKEGYKDFRGLLDKGSKPSDSTPSKPTDSTPSSNKPKTSNTH